MEEKKKKKRGEGQVGQDMGGGTRLDEASTYLRVCQK